MAESDIKWVIRQMYKDSCRGFFKRLGTVNKEGKADVYNTGIRACEKYDTVEAAIAFRDKLQALVETNEYLHDSVFIVEKRNAGLKLYEISVRVPMSLYQDECMIVKERTLWMLIDDAFGTLEDFRTKCFEPWRELTKDFPFFNWDASTFSIVYPAGTPWYDK